MKTQQRKRKRDRLPVPEVMPELPEVRELRPAVATFDVNDRTPEQLKRQVSRRIRAMSRREVYVWNVRRKLRALKTAAPTPAEVYQKLRARFERAASRPSPNHVLDVACRIACVKVVAVWTGGRTKRVMAARYGAAGYLRDLGFSYQQIARSIGTDSHSVAVRGCVECGQTRRQKERRKELAA